MRYALETERTISNDWVIRHDGHYLQLQPGSRRYGPTKSKALVCEWEDGTMEVYYRGERIEFTELPETARNASPPVLAVRTVVVRKAKRDHPWRRGYQNMKPWIPKTGIAGARYAIHGTRTRGTTPPTATVEARRTGTPRRFHADMAKAASR